MFVVEADESDVYLPELVNGFRGCGILTASEVRLPRERGGRKKFMITHIEIDCFKTFKDFKVELAPFQVIVGPNGAGKSNLFDALHLLSRLAEDDLPTAFQGLRGDIDELFTKLPDGRIVDQMRLGVEMLVNRRAQDEFGSVAELKYTRLRYELEIVRGVDIYGLDRLYVRYESLKTIPWDKDSWCKKYNISSENNWLTKLAVAQNIPGLSASTLARILISTEQIVAPPSPQLTSDSPIINITLHHEDNGKGRTISAQQAQRTVLSGVNTTDFPHTFAVREELRSLRFLYLNPEALRQSSPTKAPRFLASNGGNLPTTLARMQAEDKFALNDVSLDLANLVPDLVEVGLQEDEYRNEYTVWAKYMDGCALSSRVLSEGTLRLLALVTLKNDVQFRGILCLEESENGIHPSYLNKVARLLHGMATDFRDPQQADEPLRQVLVTTHSPTFISSPEVVDTLLFAHTVTRVAPLSSGQPSMQITLMTPAILLGRKNGSAANTGDDEAMSAYTIDEVKKYLRSDHLEEARSNFEER